MLKDDLPSLQKEIVKTLAVKGPSTKNEIKVALGKDQKSIILSFKSLKKKDIIEQTGTKEYHGRIFKLWWVTILGATYALMFGVSRDILKQHALQFLDNKKEATFFFDLAEVFSPTKMFGLLKFMESVDNKKFTPKTLSFSFSEEESTKIMRVLLKYPETRSAFTKVMRKMPKYLKEIEES